MPPNEKGLRFRHTSVLRDFLAPWHSDLRNDLAIERIMLVACLQLKLHRGFPRIRESSPRLTGRR
jgi:hypothetical protein